MSTELNDLLNEARELENADSSDYTAATAAHPNRDKAKTLTVRLTDDEMVRLRATAAERGLPVSAVVRAAIAHELQDDDGREFVSILMPLAASSGEPLRSFFAPREIDALVSGCGLEVVDHPDRAELIRRYFADRTDGLQPYGGECFVTARVP